MASLILLLIAGCTSGTRTYSVSVKNDTTSDMTLVLTKDRPPFTDAWASPEDIDDGRAPGTPESHLGIAPIAPHTTQGVKNVSGRFNRATHAILRIYRGYDLSFHEMLPIVPGPDRQDVILKPGDNRFVIHDESGRLNVQPVSP